MASNTFDFGYVLETVSAAVNKVVGLFGTEEDPDSGEQFESEHWGHFGFDSRPHPKDDKGRCEVIFSRDQDDVTICTKDRRYKIKLYDGEVALYTGKDGKVKCRQLLKPDGDVTTQGRNVGIQAKKDGGSGGDVVISVEKSLTLTRSSGTASVIAIKDDGGIQAVTSGGSTLSLDPSGKATLAVNMASITLEAGKVVINAPEISIVGSAAVGIAPNQLPVATIGCLAGIFPIVNGSIVLRAQYP